MAYDRHVSHNSIAKMVQYLDMMLSNPDTILEFPREVHDNMQIALYCAKALKHPKYRGLRAKWTLKRGEKCFAVPKGMKLSVPKKEPKFSDVINPNILLRRKDDGER